MKNILIPLFVFIILVNSSYAATHFASPTGQGTICSQSNPCGIEYALETKPVAGDTVILLPGRYNINPIVVTDDRLTIRSSGGNRPVLDGGYIRLGKRDNGDFYMAEGRTSNLNVGQWEGLLTIEGDNVILEDIEITRSSGVGLKITGDDVVIRDIKIHYTFSEGLSFLGTDDDFVQGGLAEDIEVTDVTRKHIDDDCGATPPKTACPGAICTKYVEDVTYRRINLHNTHWYGFDRGFNRDITIEDSVIYNVNSQQGIYVICWEGGTIRNNLIYATDDLNFEGYRYSDKMAGIRWQSECHKYRCCSMEKYPTHIGDVNIYGNVLVNVGTGIYIGQGSPNNAYTPGSSYPERAHHPHDARVFNNHIIGSSNTAIRLHAGNPGPNYFYNNIIWNLDSGATFVGNPSMGVFDNNLWSSQPEIAARGSNDPPYGLPRTAKKSGFASIDEEELAWTDFVLDDNSPAIGEGKSMDSGLYDHFNSRFGDSGWDIGAIDHNDGVSTCNPDWECTSWTTDCSAGIRTRICMDENSCGSDIGKPSESQSYTCTETCTPDWQCTVWTADCNAGTRTRQCIDDNSCGSDSEKPSETQPYTCTEICTPDWQCSAWSTDCELGTRTRECVDASSCGVEIAKPVESQPYICLESYTVRRITSGKQDLEAISLDASTAAMVIGDTPVASDASAMIYMGWDDTHLHLFVDVLDDQIMHDSTDLWNDDAIEVFIEGTKDNVKEYDDDDNKFILSSDGRVQQNGIWEYESSMTTTSTGYSIIFKLDFSVMGIIPSDGHELGFNLQLVDDDDGDRKDSALRLEMADPDGTHPNSDTNQFMTIVLEGDSSDMSLFEVMNTIIRYMSGDASTMELLQAFTAWKSI